MPDDTPIGWHRDPESPGRHRYWNGEDWESQCDRLGGVHREDGCDCRVDPG